MTPGTNKAIFDGYDKGYINSCSIMTNCDYFTDAVRGLNERKGLKVGVHLNITYGESLNNSLIYNDTDSFFNLSYLQILRKSIFEDQFLEQVKKEFELQIQKAIQGNIKVSHLDSHRHIHLIPKLYEIVYDLSEKYGIDRVRLVNENFRDSVKMTKSVNFLINGGLIKYLLLKLFTIVNKRYGDKCGGMSFYSILYTGVLGRSSLLKILGNDTNYEIVVHPSCIDLDKEIIFYDEAEKAYRLSENRSLELSSVLKQSQNA